VFGKNSAHWLQEGISSEKNISLKITVFNLILYLLNRLYAYSNLVKDKDGIRKPFVKHRIANIWKGANADLLQDRDEYFSSNSQSSSFITIRLFIRSIC
jgi:hypothetical protein